MARDFCGVSGGCGVAAWWLPDISALARSLDLIPTLCSSTIPSLQSRLAAQSGLAARRSREGVDGPAKIPARGHAFLSFGRIPRVSDPRLLNRHADSALPGSDASEAASVGPEPCHDHVTCASHALVTWLPIISLVPADSYENSSRFSQQPGPAR